MSGGENLSACCLEVSSLSLCSLSAGRMPPLLNIYIYTLSHLGTLCCNSLLTLGRRTETQRRTNGKRRNIFLGLERRKTGAGRQAGEAGAGGGRGKGEAGWDRISLMFLLTAPSLLSSHSSLSLHLSLLSLPALTTFHSRPSPSRPSPPINGGAWAWSQTGDQTGLGGVGDQWMDVLDPMASIYIGI